MVLGRKRVLVICMIFMSIGALFLLGEVSVRLFVKNGDVTPDVLRNRSVQYEPAIFSRHVFKQEARTIKHASGSKKGVEWEISEKVTVVKTLRRKSLRG